MSIVIYDAKKHRKDLTPLKVGADPPAKFRYTGKILPYSVKEVMADMPKYDIDSFESTISEDTGFKVKVGGLEIGKLKVYLGEFEKINKQEGTIKIKRKLRSHGQP